MDKATRENLISKAETYAYALGCAEYRKLHNPSDQNEAEFIFSEGRLMGAKALLRILQLVDDVVEDNLNIVERQHGYDAAKARYSA